MRRTIDALSILLSAVCSASCAGGTSSLFSAGPRTSAWSLERMGEDYPSALGALEAIQACVEATTDHGVTAKADGVGLCAASQYIAPETALCLASEAGLEEGLRVLPPKLV